jgi:hypothetical protein
MADSRVRDVRPASTRGTLPTALLPTLGAAGHACPEARLAARPRGGRLKARRSGKRRAFSTTLSSLERKAIQRVSSALG